MRIAIFGMTFPETSKNYLQHLIKKIENENLPEFTLTISNHFAYLELEITPTREPQVLIRVMFRVVHVRFLRAG